MDTPKFQTLRVREKRWLHETVFELRLESPEPYAFQAGQWMSVLVPLAGAPALRRAYSIASPPTSPTIEICVQAIEEGVGSTYLRQLEAGDSIETEGPFGTFFFHPKPGRGAVFLATGTGIAPFRSMLLTPELVTAAPIWCALGVRTVRDLLYAEDLRNLPGVQWRACLSRDLPPGDRYRAGRVTDWLGSAEAASIAWAQTDFYLCGNGQMVRDAKALLKTRGVEKASIHTETFFKPWLTT